MGFTPTAEQQVAREKFATGESLAIEAGAGAGKTSTLTLLASDVTGRNGQYIAFNKAIVDESKLKMPRHVACNTAHSLAMRNVGKNYRHRLNSGRMKSTDIARRLNVKALEVKVQDGTTKKLSPSFLAGLAMRAVERFCQSADVAPRAEHVPYVRGIDLPPGRMANNERVRAWLLPTMEAIWRDAQDVNGTLPYKHSYYLKQWQLSGPRIGADFILFDEAQDANPVMVAIVAAQTHAQLVWVGDSQQQIYSFTGAVNALQDVPATQRAFLTQSFRFGPAIADVANRVLADLDADLRLSGTETIESVVEQLDAPDAVLTRTNAAAIAEVLNALAAGVSVHLVGGGREVVAFAEAALDLQRSGWTSHQELTCFSSWSEVQRYVEEDEQGDELRLMVRLVDEFGAQAIVDAMRQMPKENEAELVVSTAHKAKGREWNRVRLGADFPEEPTGEELRLLYVAVTRARLSLDVTQVMYFAGVDTTARNIEAIVELPSPEEDELHRTVSDAIEEAYVEFVARKERDEVYGIDDQHDLYVQFVVDALTRERSNA